MIANLMPTGSGWIPVLTGILAIALYCSYKLLLPRPLPGIPYNRDAAKRLMGDITTLKAMDAAGINPRRYWSDMAIEHQSPITQVFLGPFAKPSVVISDFREAKDLMVKRGKDFGRGRMNREAWHGIVPEHFIGIDESHPTFHEKKDLLKDLMTPRFLQEANAPASYLKVLDFIKYWQEKAKIAQGRPFAALDDISVLTYDIILAAAVGHNKDEAEAARRILKVQDLDASALLPKDEDEAFPFPVPEISELQKSVVDISSAAGEAFMQVSPKWWHVFNNRTPVMKSAIASKKSCLQHYIDLSVQRLDEEGANFEPKSAVDYVVFREKGLAAKAGRPPAWDSQRLNDMIFGYLVGGQDSTHSTLSFLVKHLEENQESQNKLRGILRQTFPEAVANGEQPSLQGILKTSIPYLDALIQEVLRMSDPTKVVSKESLCDMEVLGHHVPKGTMFLFCLTGSTFQEPEIPVAESKRSNTSQKGGAGKFDDWSKSDYPADKFYPERWLRRNEDGTEVYDSQMGPFLAFSLGKRGCWGQRLAYLELRLAVALMVWNFNFETVPAGMDGWELDDILFVKPRQCYVRLSSAN